MSAVPHLWAVIPSGGAGTRLWPLSRAASPKFLHDLTGSGRSLLQGTVDRLRPLVADRVLVVTGEGHAPIVRDQLAGLVPDDAVIAEPAPRDSMAAVGLAAALLERRDPEAVMGSFAADHVVEDGNAFAEAVRLAAEVARSDWLVTLGVAPTHPATGFGYLHVGEPLTDHPGGFALRRFVEKPSAVVAEQYLAGGEHRWNAGMFLVRPGVLLDLLADGHPDFAADLRAIAAEPGSLTEVWPRLPRISLDHAVAEPASEAGRVAMVPADFDWDDVGDFSGLAGLLGATEAGVTVLGDEALVRSLDASGLAVPAAGRLVALLGVEDVVVVDTPDAVLVTTRARAQEVRSIVAALGETGRADLL